MQNYSTILKTRSFLYLELKKAASLRLQGISGEEIKQKALDENLFLLKTEKRIKEIASTITERLEVLDRPLLQKITMGSLETSKQLALYAILKTDRLFFEFMQEVFREKYLLRDYIITDKDFNIFFQRKAEQSQTVASWTDYTYYKLQQVYKRILMEAGLAKKQKKNIEIIRPMVEKDVIEHLKNKGDEIYLKAMLGDI
ncbi:DUF1819 family protein [Dehalobacterium formicoaceticum]|uniref:DUF1819 family protein n=1 Tax=Dehalobacterium formicoaceticum TaxID=51515 RepID=A0ABT1Y1L9_9FIRM|nr:DUF1819 family protein [Dehalobacterium formicoaceticum]MCR6544411.1 DUF1819 family protein [Dehalobacterium formicoaceticum]